MSTTKTEDNLPMKTQFLHHLNLELPLQSVHSTTLFHNYLFLYHRRYLDYLVMSNFLYPLPLQQQSTNFLPSLYQRIRLGNCMPFLSQNLGSACLRKSGRSGKSGFDSGGPLNGSDEASARAGVGASFGEDCEARRENSRMNFERG